MRTQTDPAPRDLNGISSDQNVVKIMLLYFQKNYGFPMLRSTQNDEKSILGCSAASDQILKNLVLSIQKCRKYVF